MNINTDTLLRKGEPSPFKVINRNGSCSAVLICDHASNQIPNRLGDLGLTPLQLTDHISWDSGAADVALCLSSMLDAPLVLSAYSRLVIDCNRPLGHKDSIAEHSGGVAISGNQNLSPEQKKHRADALFYPYHQAIARLLNARVNKPTVLISIHSFTPNFLGQARPWHIGVSSYEHHHFSLLMKKTLTNNTHLLVGQDQPYPIESDIDYSIPHHSKNRDLPSIMLEIRQDEINTKLEAKAWAIKIARAYQEIEEEII